MINVILPNAVSAASTSLIRIVSEPYSMEIAQYIFVGLNLRIDTSAARIDTSAAVLLCNSPGYFYALSLSDSQVTTQPQHKHSV